MVGHERYYEVTTRISGVPACPINQHTIRPTHDTTTKRTCAPKSSVSSVYVQTAACASSFAVVSRRCSTVLTIIARKANTPRSTPTRDVVSLLQETTVRVGGMLGTRWHLGDEKGKFRAVAEVGRPAVQRDGRRKSQSYLLGLSARGDSDRTGQRPQTAQSHANSRAKLSRRGDRSI
jgi:hypothetical protein